MAFSLVVTPRHDKLTDGVTLRRGDASNGDWMPDKHSLVPWRRSAHRPSGPFSAAVAAAPNRTNRVAGAGLSPISFRPKRRLSGPLPVREPAFPPTVPPPHQGSCGSNRRPFSARDYD